MSFRPATRRSLFSRHTSRSSRARLYVAGPSAEHALRGFPATAALLLAALLFLRGPFVCAEENLAPSTAEAIAGEVRAIFTRCQKAVVHIQAVDIHGPLSGTGFFIDPNGTLYTSYTIGGESRDIVVCNGDLRYPATRIAADPRSGVAILKVDAETPFLMPGKARELQVAAPVITIGYPMDLPLTPTFGTVGGFDLKYLGRYFATTHIRANLPVQRGEGGAPLLNMRGEVVGILISSLDSGSASFVLPIEAAEKVRKDYLRFGEVRPGWIGLKVGPAADPAAVSQARIDDIVADGPADKAGLQPGDLLLQIGDKKITALEDVLDASFFATAGDSLPVKVLRDAQPLDLTLQPLDHPGTSRLHTGGLPTSQPQPPPPPHSSPSALLAPGR